MKINSQFKDYYDTVGYTAGLLPTGDDLVYNRFSQEVKHKTPQILNLVDRPFRYSTACVGFCGKVYNLAFQNIKVGEEYNPFTRLLDPVFVNRIITDPAMVEDDEFHRNRSRYYTKLLMKTIEKHYIGAKDETHPERMDYGPIYYIESQDDPCRIIHNPNLSVEIPKFKAILRPRDAYQTLERWFANQVKPNRVPSPISDELKAETHGFDRYSFRGPIRDKKPRCGRKV